MEGCVEPQHSRAALCAGRQRQEDRGLTPSGSTAARGSRRGKSARSQFGVTMIEGRDLTWMVAGYVVAGLLRSSGVPRSGNWPQPGSRQRTSTVR